MQERDGRHMRSIISKEKIKKKNERVYEKVMERVEKESEECWKKKRYACAEIKRKSV
jgi:hypothetical protein